MKSNFADLYFVEPTNPHVIYVLPRPRQTFFETFLANEKVLELLQQLLLQKLNGRAQHAKKADGFSPADGVKERDVAATD